MLLVRRLRLLSPLLAARHSSVEEGPRRVFVKYDKSPPNEPGDRIYIAAQRQRWVWALLEARDALCLEEVAVSAIIPPRWYAAKRTSTYNRKYRVGKQMRQEGHEALSTGQVIEVKLTLSKHIPPGTDGGGRFTRPPDEEEMDAMITHIGEYLGMSEWGHGYDYGRFEIQTYDVASQKSDTKND